mmetsp:Transcript_63947/g.129894  ORF Transcript_63947/g.129894 Transcript_63947/m.129894 type:complete len:86 (-) Transcript_63947:1-258(-)
MLCYCKSPAGTLDHLRNRELGQAAVAFLKSVKRLRFLKKLKMLQSLAHPVLVLPAGSEALLRRIQIFHISNGRVVLKRRRRRMKL